MPASNLITALLNTLEPWPALAFFLEFTLKSSLVLLTCLLLSLLIRHSTAARQHLLWTTCILSLICLPLFLALLPDWNLPWLPALQTLQPTSTVAQDFSSIATWWPRVLVLYLAGLGLLVFANMFSLLRILLLNWLATNTHNTQALQLLDELLLDAMTDVQVQLKEHPQLESPLSWGLLHPAILLPVASKHWSSAKMRHVLLHELQHIQRLDWVSMIAGRYACALYWYNPMVWLAAHKMSQQAELACDDAVVLTTNRQSAYAADLVQIARDEQASSRFKHLAKAMAASFLGSRVVAILDVTRVRKHLEEAWVFHGIVAGFILTAVLAALRLTPATPELPYDWNGQNIITLRFLRSDEAAPSPSLPEPSPHPTLVLSYNFPELETIYVRPAVALAAQTTDLAPATSISVQEISSRPISQPPLLLLKEFPAYPAAARTRQIEGFVTIEYSLDTAGRVNAPQVVEASPPQIFEQAALEAISGYQYEPPRVNGQAVPVSGLRTRFIFRLDEEAE